MDSTRQNRVSNSLLIAISAHLVFAMLLALTLTTDFKEKDYIELDWVKLPRTARTIKKPKIKRVEPTIRIPKVAQFSSTSGQSQCKSRLR